MEKQDHHEVVLIVWKDGNEFVVRQFDPNETKHAGCLRTTGHIRKLLAGDSKIVDVITGQKHSDVCVSRSLQFICKVLDGDKDPKSCPVNKRYNANTEKCI